MSNINLIFQTRNLWNSKLRFNQEAYFSTNLMLKDKIRKIFKSKKFVKVKKIKIKK
jgi:hypothetical protein